MAVEMDSVRVAPRVDVRKDWFDSDGIWLRTSGLEKQSQDKQIPKVIDINPDNGELRNEI